MTSEEAIRRLAESKSRIATFGVRRLAVFGSVARGEQTPASDIDVLVDFEPPATFDRYDGLASLLEEVLGAQVDLVTAASLREPFRTVVMAEACDVAQF